MKGSHNILARLSRAKKRQQSPLIKQFTDHSAIVEPDNYIIVQKIISNDDTYLYNPMKHICHKQR